MIFKKRQSMNQIDLINSPVVGSTLSLELVNDNVFSKKLLGDGEAFTFEGDTIFSPCNGEIIMIAATKHAFGIKTDNGTEIILHVGLDTVNLNGQGMELLVKKNKKIKKNQPILKLNRKFMNEKNVDLTIILIVVNNSDYELSIEKNDIVDLDSVVIKTKRIKKKSSNENAT